MKPFAYDRAESVADGTAALAGGARVLAGGTDLIPLMQEGLLAPARLIDVSSLTGALREVRGLEDGGLELGALVTLSEIARHERVRTEYPALALAAAGAASPQIRNAATLGGNLCQWNRCWYFRSGASCHLSGGDHCPAALGDNRFHAIFRDGPCIAVHASDPAVALTALGARVRVQGRGPAREIALSRFLQPPRPGRPDQTDLQPDEVLAGVVLPPPAGGSRFHKAMDRQVWTFALVSAAAVVDIRGGRVQRAALALGGVAGVPWEAGDAAASLLGQALTEASADRAAELAVAGAQPFAHNGYKVELARRVVRTVLLELAGA